MKVGFWAEIQRCHEIKKQSNRAIAKSLGCCAKTVKKALEMEVSPSQIPAARRASVLDPYKPMIDELIEKYPDLSAIRILEEIARGPDGYAGSVYPLRRYLRTIRPARKRVYQEAHYDPGEAMQVDWGTCGWVRIGAIRRRVSVLVAVLCFSRLTFIKFTLSQSKECFYRAIADACAFFGGLTEKLIFDNLKAAVIAGHGRHAVLHPEFLALCGHYRFLPIACQRDDPETKGTVECGVKYVKQNALKGRDEQLKTFEGYKQLEVYWRDSVANVREHATTGEQPRVRFEREKQHLRALPAKRPDTDDDAPRVVSNHCRVRFDANRYSVPPEYCGKPVAVKANDDDVWVLHDGQEIARHTRCYEKRQLCCLPEHRIAALQKRHRAKASQLEREFDALGAVAQDFHLKLMTMPVQKNVHLRKLLKLVRLYGRRDVLEAISTALQVQACDAPSVENILMQQRRRRCLPSPMPVRPKRAELINDIHLPEPDLAKYDRIFGLDDDMGERMP